MYSFSSPLRRSLRIHHTAQKPLEYAIISRDIVRSLSAFAIWRSLWTEIRFFWCRHRQCIETKTHFIVFRLRSKNFRFISVAVVHTNDKVIWDSICACAHAMIRDRIIVWPFHSRTHRINDFFCYYFVSVPVPYSWDDWALNSQLSDICQGSIGANYLCQEIVWVTE